MTPSPPPAEQQQSPGTPGSWMQRASGLLFVLLTLELGLFLLVYPWMDAWNRNSLLLLRPEWYDFLMSNQFRGALSGLGVLNLLISAGETLRMLIAAARRRRS